MCLAIQLTNLFIPNSIKGTQLLGQRHTTCPEFGCRFKPEKLRVSCSRLVVVKFTYIYHRNHGSIFQHGGVE